MNKIPQKDLDMYPLEKEFVSKLKSNKQHRIKKKKNYCY